MRVLQSICRNINKPISLTVFILSVLVSVCGTAVYASPCVDFSGIYYAQRYTDKCFRIIQTECKIFLRQNYSMGQFYGFELATDNSVQKISDLVTVTGGHKADGKLGFLYRYSPSTHSTIERIFLYYSVIENGDLLVDATYLSADRSENIKQTWIKKESIQQCLEQ
jgi:hypothetical protein